MVYYVGKNFDKNKCKQYKTTDGAVKAAAKDQELSIWDEDGNPIVQLETKGKDTESKERTSETPANGNEHKEGSGDEDANKSTDEQLPDETGEKPRENQPDESNNVEASNEDNQKTENKNEEEVSENQIIIPQGKMKVTVICEGSLNIRRSPQWGNENICGRAVRGQSYYVKEIHVVDGKKMVRTIGDLYLSGEMEYVQYEQLSRKNTCNT